MSNGFCLTCAYGSDYSEHTCVSDYDEGYDAGRAAGFAEGLEAAAKLFCECRPLDLSRDSHSHDCDTHWFDLIRALAPRKP